MTISGDTDGGAVIRDFGVTTAAKPVQAITLTAGALTARLLTLGAILQDVRLYGVHHGLTLNFPDVAGYEGSGGWHGPLVGPVANRIAGAQARVGGRICHFPANEGRTTTLHSGAAGIDGKIWTIAAVDAASVTLTLTLPDGEGGFPGTRRLTALWQVLPPATLRLTLTATTDAPTLMNLANHSYWNLDGTSVWQGHRLRILADAVLPVDAAGIPTGEIRPVAGSDLDFRLPRALQPGHPALDHNFCLSDGRVPLRDVAILTGASGVTMTLATTEPGLQAYDGRGARAGHPPYEGIALEPQFWPDAPHHPAFPPIDLGPGQPWQQITEWRFSRP